MYKHFTFGKPVRFTKIFSSTKCLNCEKTVDFLLEMVSDQQLWPVLVLDVVNVELVHVTTATRHGYVLFFCLSANDTEIYEKEVSEVINLQNGRNVSNYKDFESSEERGQDNEEGEENGPMVILAGMLNKLIVHSGINSNSKFIVISTGCKEEEISPIVADSIFEVLWESARITDVILVVGSPFGRFKQYFRC